MREALSTCTLYYPDIACCFKYVQVARSMCSALTASIRGALRGGYVGAERVVHRTKIHSSQTDLNCSNVAQRPDCLLLLGWQRCTATRNCLHNDANTCNLHRLRCVCAQCYLVCSMLLSVVPAQYCIVLLKVKQCSHICNSSFPATET
jgi:hypothetical protein